MVNVDLLKIVAEWLTVSNDLKVVNQLDHNFSILTQSLLNLQIQKLLKSNLTNQKLNQGFSTSNL